MASHSFKSTLFWLAGAFLYLSPPAVQAVTSYANVFFNPDVLAAGSFNQTTLSAQKTIVSWAQDLASQGPWTVTSKEMTPPSGNKHDYMSFSPYAWPDCSKAGNTTELTPEQIWTTCEYVTRDGQFNPDARMVNDIGNFDDMADAVLYNALAFVIDGSSTYSANAAKFVDTWFLNPDTAMTPNLNFAQMRRGPDGQNGTHTGVLDLKCMAKVVTGIMVLRARKAPEWTADLDGKMTAWAKEYVTWLQTASNAIEEAQSTNNHGSFYYNQLAALQILTGDKDAAQKSIQTYFAGIYLKQIAANGDQPLESARTRPYHYRAYNLAAMITNARLGEYVGFNAWHLQTNGATIQNALDFAMQQKPGADTPDELYPHVATVGMEYGDPHSTYASFLHEKLNWGFIINPYYLWDDIFLAGLPTPTSSSSAASHSPSVKPTGASDVDPANQHKGGYKPESGALSEFALAKSWYILYGVVAAVITATCHSV
ncbi:hypothetical protein EIP91_009802 [Steccherinum ochraceum]|uniref:Alginate lyase domain-containing protein n=1 Tax=Steccherinum ochraceum TaxID=92696 RepID=A0A4R0RXD8_9APHY|nr:hypothetical protein EIP91_009802 [Steccherinum ochraceum]